jgi:hypothetical protein
VLGIVPVSELKLTSNAVREWKLPIKVGRVPASPKLCRSSDMTLAYVAAVEPHVTPWKEHQLGWVVNRLLDSSKDVSSAAASCSLL